MKINTLVMFEHNGIARFGVVKSLTTHETINHTALSAEVRYQDGKKVYTIHHSPELLLDLTEHSEEQQWFHDPVLGLLRRSDDYNSACAYRQKRIEKPDEDPDEIPF